MLCGEWQEDDASNRQPLLISAWQRYLISELQRLQLLDAPLPTLSYPHFNVTQWCAKEHFGCSNTASSAVLAGTLYCFTGQAL